MSAVTSGVTPTEPKSWPSGVSQRAMVSLSAPELDRANLCWTVFLPNVFSPTTVALPLS